jgi:release factor glutamine methyltransferase
MRVIVLPGVFHPRSDTRLLAKAACEQRVDGRILELCAGPALAGIAAARRADAHLTTVDVSRRAVLNARINARLAGVRISARRGDLFDVVQGELFDLILANPPYVPGAPPPARGSARATDAGADGRALLDRICADAAAYLNPGGSLLIVQSEVSGIGPTLTSLQRRGLQTDVVERHTGPLGPLLRARRGELEARGQLRPGQDSEEVLVLRGRQPEETRARQLAPTQVA